MGGDVTNFRCTDILPRVTNSTRLRTTNFIDTLIPSPLDEILQFQNPRCASRKFLLTLSMSTLDIRDEHLNVAVTAEATLLGRLADVERGWVTVVSLPDGTIESGELGENRDDAGGLILNDFLFDETAVSADAVDDGGLGAFLELVVQPTGHALFPGVRAELGTL